MKRNFYPLFSVFIRKNLRCHFYNLATNGSSCFVRFYSFVLNTWLYLSLQVIIIKKKSIRTFKCKYNFYLLARLLYKFFIFE